MGKYNSYFKYIIRVYSKQQNSIFTDNNQTVFTGGSINIFRYTEGAGLGAMKLYSFKIYDDDILIGNFIPVKDENDVVCLYDKVSATYFYNLGTGTFVAGPEVN